MKWKIVVDSGCNINNLENLAPDTKYEKVPLTIQIGKNSYIDDGKLDMNKLVDEMYTSSEKTSSSCPSPEAYKESYLGAENIIVLTITSALSGSYNSARIAKDMLLEENKDVNIAVIDTKSAGAEIDLIIGKINNLISKGLNFEEVVKKTNEYVNNTRLLFVLEKVDNLVKNGRLSKLAGGVIGLLNIKLIAKASTEGTIELLHKARGSKKALVTLIDEMLKEGYKGGKVSISHCQNLTFCQELKQKILEKFPEAVIDFLPNQGLCTFYSERGGVMMGYEI